MLIVKCLIIYFCVVQLLAGELNETIILEGTVKEYIELNLQDKENELYITGKNENELKNSTRPVTTTNLLDTSSTIDTSQISETISEVNIFRERITTTTSSTETNEFIDFNTNKNPWSEQSTSTSLTSEIQKLSTLISSTFSIENYESTKADSIFEESTSDIPFKYNSHKKSSLESTLKSEHLADSVSNSITKIIPNIVTTTSFSLLNQSSIPTTINSKLIDNFTFPKSADTSEIILNKRITSHSTNLDTSIEEVPIKFISNVYGSALHHTTDTYKFRVDFADLKSLTIFYDRIINGFEFQFLNNTRASYGYTTQGNETNSNISIDFATKEIKSVRIGHFYWVNSLQFEMYDRVTNTTDWIGSYDKVSNDRKSILNVTSEKLTLIGEVDTSDEIFGEYLQSIQFEYFAYQPTTIQQNSVSSTIVSISTTTNVYTATSTPIYSSFIFSVLDNTSGVISNNTESIFVNSTTPYIITSYIFNSTTHGISPSDLTNSSIINSTSLYVNYSTTPYIVTTYIINSTVHGIELSNHTKSLSLNSTSSYIINTTIPDIITSYFINSSTLNSTSHNIINSTTIGKEIIDKCKSNIYGHALETNDTYKFRVVFADLKSLTIFYDKIVNGFEFQFLNNTRASYGYTTKRNETNSNISIDFATKEIKSVKIGHFYWVNSLQFEMYDRVTNTTDWIGSYDKVSNDRKSILNVTSEKLTLIGEVDTSDEIFGEFLQSIQFECPLTRIEQSVIQVRTSTSGSSGAGNKSGCTDFALFNYFLLFSLIISTCSFKGI